MSRSPLEILHPNGWVDRSAVIGHGAEAAHVTPTATGVDSSLDLVLLAPSPNERRERGWAREAARLASRIARDGLVVASSPSRRLRAELTAVGLERQERLLHVPDVPRSRYVLPLRGVAARYALRHLLPLHPLKRAAARGLALPGAAMLVPTTEVFRRPGSRPLLEWLAAYRPSVESCSALVTRSWRPAGATVAHRFKAQGPPDVVAKVGGGAAAEAHALRILGPIAQGGLAKPPELLAEGRLGPDPLVVETALAGTPAPRLLRGSRKRALQLLRRVAKWLEEWNRATELRRPFAAADAELYVLSPARRLAPLLDEGAEYLSWLERLCDRCTDSAVPFVATHNDLTAANLLVGDGEQLGIADWEHAAPRGLPLGDLAYAAADFAAALDGYRDRPAAFGASFHGGDAYAELTRALLSSAAAAHELDPPVVELCLQACWLHHADNERRDAAIIGVGDRPFLVILRRAAASAMA